MMWKEFEEIAGYEVSFEDYNNVIEPMYMATNLSKAEFVKCIDKKRFALKTRKQLINEMRKKAEEIRCVVEHNGAYDLKDELQKMAYSYAKRFHAFDRGNLDCYCYFMHGYTLPNMRGCSFPTEMVIGYKNNDYERIELLKA